MQKLFLSGLLIALFALTACVSEPQKPTSTRQWWLESGGEPVMRPSTQTSTRTFFPADELRHRRTGSVVFEYSISPQGRAMAITALESSSDSFTKQATGFLQTINFAIPKDWEQIGGMTRRFKFQVVFNIAGLPAVKQIEGVTTLVITTASMQMR
jgi:hypothetical protein